MSKPDEQQKKAVEGLADDLDECFEAAPKHVDPSLDRREDTLRMVWP